jgi:hypothetical protein
VLRSVNGLKHAKNDGECKVTSDCFIHAHTDLLIHLAMLMTSVASLRFYVISDLATRQRRLKSTRGEDLGGGSSLTWPYFTVRSTLITRPINNRNNTRRRTFFSFIYYDIETTHSQTPSYKRLHNKRIT